jgi:Saccharopine dehydrogenase NADP binding domain
MARILVIGGTGAFTRAAKTAADLGQRARAAVSSTSLDATTVTAAALTALGAGIVINASGPFQGQDYGLARACIEARCHYIDLADARAFVTGFAALDAPARTASVTLVSGASTVPGLSTAVIAAYRDAFEPLEAIEIAVSPGNSFDPGIATMTSVLGYVGHPIRMQIGGAGRTVYGWQGTRRTTIAGVGPRLVGYADVPDLDLFMARDPKLRTVTMRAGVEVPLFHAGIWAASWLVRAGLAGGLPQWSAALLRAKRAMPFLGSDRGGMRVDLTGRAGGGRRHIAWHLAAGSGHGPYIPAIASVILARKLAAGQALPAGAMACVDLFTLAEFSAEVADLDITFTLETAIGQAKLERA